MKVDHMRVAFIHYTAPDSEQGGVETVIGRQAKFLLKYGVRVTFIFGKGGGLDPKITEIQIPELHSTHPEIRPLQTLLYSKKTKDEEFRKKFDEVKNIIKEKIKQALAEIDICIVHNMSTMPFNFPATIAINELTEELKHIGFVYWLHDSVVLREQWQSYLNIWPYTELHYKSDRIHFVTITRYRERQFSTLPDKFRISNIRIIPNGINVEDYLKLDETTLLLKKKVVDVFWEDLVLLMPIRITPRKNIELGIRVLAELKKFFVNICCNGKDSCSVVESVDRAHVKLLITGPPDNQAVVEGQNYIEYLRQLAEDLGVKEDIYLLHEFISFNREYRDGKIYKFSVADAYALADIVLITSIEEGFGLPLVEAAAARKPIFCSRIPPFQEILREGIDGHMFDLADPPTNIAYRIYKFYLDNVVEHGFTRVLELYSWKEILETKFLALLNSIIYNGNGNKSNNKK